MEEEEEKNKETDLSNKYNITKNENPILNNNSEVFRHKNLQKIKINEEKIKEQKEQKIEIQTDSQNTKNQNYTENNFKTDNLIHSTFNYIDKRNYYLKINRCLTTRIKKVILILCLIISTFFLILSILDILNFKNRNLLMNNLFIYFFQIFYALSLIIFQILTILLEPKENIIFNIISILFISLIIILRTNIIIKNDIKRFTIFINLLSSFFLTFINIGIFLITLKIVKMKKNVQQNIEEIINFSDILQATNIKISDKKDNQLILNNSGSEYKTEFENQNDNKGITVLVKETNNKNDQTKTEQK